MSANFKAAVEFVLRPNVTINCMVRKRNVNTKSISIAIILILIIFGVFALAASMNSNKSFDSFVVAQKSCKQEPVIASIEDGEKNYYVPSSSNNKILSVYDPRSLSMSDYPRATFYCNVEDATRDGYSKHECCGLKPPNEGR